MRLTPDRCLQCSTPVRPSAPIPGTYPDLASDGKFADTPYWFCGRDCYARAIDDFVPARWRFDAKSDKDAILAEQTRYLQRDLEKYQGEDYSQSQYDEKFEEAQTWVEINARNWLGEKLSNRANAQPLLKAFIYNEMKLEQRKLDEKAEEERVREQAKLEAERIRADAKVEVERLRQQAKDDAERIKQQAKDEAERKKIEEAMWVEAAELQALAEKVQDRPIPEALRSQHTHILAPSGYGKTTLLQQIIIDDLEKANPPGYIVIDPKGELVDRIARRALFNPVNGRLKDRLVVIDPTDDELPALNMFAMPDVPARAKERILNQLIETFAYVFSSSDARLTQRQAIPFSYVIKLVFSMGGDINTLMDILEDTKEKRRFAEPIRVLSETDLGAKRFFETDFYEAGFKPTREQIRTRLYEIISRPDLMRIFAAKENNLSIFDAIQQGKMILVNTALPQMGARASTLLGRYFIALTLNAAFTRFTVPKEQWRPAYLMIDEFQDYVDEEKTPEMLRLSREYNLGVIIAHQTMHGTELNEALRNSISTNTNIKFAAGSEGIDRGYVARDLRCTQEFLTEYTEPHKGHANFACYVRGMGLQHPFLRKVKFGNIQEQPQMAADVYKWSRVRNSARLTAAKESISKPVQPSTARPEQRASIPVQNVRPSPITKPPINKQDSAEPSDTW